jgi:heme iron utilization protein
MTARRMDHSAVQQARWLIRMARFGSLATVNHGTPYASLTGVASDQQGCPIMLLSDLARHSRNIAGDNRASLLLEEGQPGVIDPQGLEKSGSGRDGFADPLVRPRISLTGRIEAITAEEKPKLQERYLARHPDAVRFAHFSDFRLYRLRPDEGHMVAGFGSIHDLLAKQLLIAEETARQMADAEASILDHMNADHEEVLKLIATRLLRLNAGHWSICGMDCEGFDLFDSNRGWSRFTLETPLRNPAGARAVFVHLAAQARAAETES